MAYHPYAQIDTDHIVRTQSLLAGLIAHHGKVVRAVTTSSIPVVYDFSPSAPSIGWTDFQQVYLSFEKAQDSILRARNQTDMLDALVDIAAVLKHETAHVLYTPRTGSALVREVIATGSFPTLNLLEDHRIEVLFANKYPPAAKMFTHMLHRFVLGHIQPDGAFPLVVGRLYLPKSLRDAAKAAWGGNPVVADQIEVACREFITLTPSHEEDRLAGDDYRMLELIRHVENLLTSDKPNGTAGHVPDPNTQHGISRGDAPSGKSQEDAKEQAEEVKEKEESGAYDTDDIGDSESSDADESSGEGGTEEGADDSKDGGSTPGQGEGEGEEGDAAEGGDSDSTGSGDPSDEGSESAGAPDPNALSRIADRFDDFDDLLNNLHKKVQEELRKEADLSIESITAGGAISTFENKIGRLRHSQRFRTPPQTILEDAKVASLHITRELSRLRSAIEEEVFTKESRGRLHVGEIHRRLAKDKPLINVFKRWDDGQEDEAGIDMVILVDGSGSMDFNDSWSASAAAWALKKAMDKLDQPCAIIMFSDTSLVAYDINEKVGPEPTNLNDGGNTSPVQGILAAAGFFQRPNHSKVQVLVTLTDGVWSTRVQAREAIEMMNDRGVITCLFGIDGAVSKHGGHGSTISQDIDKGMDMVPIVRSVVLNAQRHVLEV